MANALGSIIFYLVVSTPTRYNVESSLLLSLITGLTSQSSPFSLANNSANSLAERQFLVLKNNALLYLRVKYMLQLLYK